MYRNYPDNLGGLGKIWEGLCPPGPNLEPPLVTINSSAKNKCKVGINTLYSM